MEESFINMDTAATWLPQIAESLNPGEISRCVEKKNNIKKSKINKKNPKIISINL